MEPSELTCLLHQSISILQGATGNLYVSAAYRGHLASPEQGVSSHKYARLEKVEPEQADWIDSWTALALAFPTISIPSHPSPYFCLSHSSGLGRQQTMNLSSSTKMSPRSASKLTTTRLPLIETEAGLGPAVGLSV